MDSSAQEDSFLSRDSFHPPVQERGKATLEKILVATEELLVEELFDEISITQILSQSGISTGSFYARFSSKDDILPLLLTRYEAKRTAYFAGALDPGKWTGLTLQETCFRLIELVAGFFKHERGVVRAFVMYYRAHPDRFSAPRKRRLDRIYGNGADLILRHREQIQHRDPAKAVRELLSLAVSAIRDNVLFSTRPKYTRPLPHGRLIQHVAHMMHSALIHAPS